MTSSSSIPLPKGLIDFATFQRESGWSVPLIRLAIAQQQLRAIRVGRDVAFHITEIPAASGSALLRKYLQEQVDLKRAELAKAEAKLANVALMKEAL